VVAEAADLVTVILFTLLPMMPFKAADGRDYTGALPPPGSTDRLLFIYLACACGGALMQARTLESFIRSHLLLRTLESFVFSHLL
jgi:hypothetical protein